jgi:hypothetical protein
MKQINQLLLGIGFSVLAIGLSAQNAPHRTRFSQPHKAKAISARKFFKSNGIAHKATSTLTTAGLQYPNTEQSLQVTYSLSGGWYTEFLNRLWTIKDTGSGTNENFDLNHSATVAFDTIIDYYSANTSYTAASGSLVVDTITALVTYRNTSTKNDTVVFFITNVLANGYPGSTVLHTDTVILNKGVGLPGNTIDTIYQIGVIPNFPIVSGSKFAVTLQFSGAKVDTFAFAYAFPNATCTSTGNVYANGFTFIGPAFGPTPYCNSFVTGWEYYENPPAYAPVTWPDTHGNQIGQLGGVPFDNDEWSMCGADTEYFYWQDNAIFATVSFISTVGINNITDNGVSVSQNYPNPFDKTTRIEYNITKPSDIVFNVYDMAGRKLIANTYSKVNPGSHQITLDANQFTPGIYFYTFDVNGKSVTKKMVITE